MTSRHAVLSTLLCSTLACGHAGIFAQGTASPDAPNSGASSGTSGAGGTAAKSGQATVPMLIIVPVEVQSDPQLYNGCWLRLVDRDAMPKEGNDILTIVGRMYLPSFKTPSGVDWSRKTDSMIVGPNASVTVYADSGYKGKSVKLTGKREIKDLNKELGFAGSIDSLRMECTS